MERDYPAKLREMAQSCYGCANCESYCPFFPKVFGLLDQEQYGKKGLIEARFESLLDYCYDCKLCKTACPFKYDLPALVQEAKAEVMRTTAPPSWIKTIFRRVDRVETLLHWFAPVVNLLTEIRPIRALMERAVGIHRNRILPRFYFLTFRMRAALWPLLGPALGEDRGEVGSAETCWKKGPRKVVYFHGCYTDHHRPEEGMAALKLLRSCGIDVVIPKQRCCGLPQVSEGFPDEGRENMACNLKTWRRYLDAGYDIVATSSPCALTLKQEYPHWMGSEAEILKDRVFEVTEYLLQLLRAGEIKPPQKPIPQRVAYHVPCHLKAQKIGMPSLELLRMVPTLNVEVVDRGCCGLAGCMGYTTETFDLSMEIGTPMMDGIREALPNLAVSDCPKCNLQIKQGTGIDAVHPLELLARGYDEIRAETVEVKQVDRPFLGKGVSPSPT